jgi:zinc/manganese transport system permease protein
MLELMAAPMVACVVLVGIHVYLGMHVIQRKVIFVDLALAQIAALGATFGFLFGYSPHGTGAFVFSLLFSLGGAAVFALSRMRHERVPQEAIIGIVYAVALASAILVADRAPEGAEHIKETLVGTILWVSWPTILKTALLYGLVGAVHVVFRVRFLQISFHPEQAYAEKRWIRLWDFLFYLTFAFVITSSVAIAGVLLVFSFLVIPAVVATMFARKVETRLAIGWSVGIVACFIGLVASYRFDMPSGPTVVASLGLSLVLAAAMYYLMTHESRKTAAARLLVGAAIPLALLAIAVVFAPGRYLRIEHEHEWEQTGSEQRGDHAEDGAWGDLAGPCGDDAGCIAERAVARDDWPEILTHRLADSRSGVREAAAEVAAEIGSPRAMDLLAAAAGAEPDPLLRLDQVRILVAANRREAFEIAVTLLEDAVPALVREEAHQLLLDAASADFGYDPLAGGTANDPAIERWRAWATTARSE